MRKQIRIRRKMIAVLGAAMVLAVTPLSASFAGFPTETKQSQGGCEAIDRTQNWSAAKVCRDLNDGATVGSTGTSQQPSELTTSSDSYFENPLLWVVAILSGAAGAFVAIVRRHHRPAALS